MGYKRKVFQKKIKQRNPIARELSEDARYHQRIKESEKDYTRKKIRVKDVYEYDEESSD